MTIEPNLELLADPDIPRVALGGLVWPIPELAWCDLKKCRSQLLELTALINEAVAPSATFVHEDEAARIASNLALISTVFQGLSNEDFDRLVMGTLHAGLQAGHPGLSRAEFESWAIEEADRQVAWLTVRRQSGLFVQSAERLPDGAEPGEADGAT